MRSVSVENPAGFLSSFGCLIEDNRLKLLKDQSGFQSSLPSSELLSSSRHHHQRLIAVMQLGRGHAPFSLAWTPEVQSCSGTHQPDATKPPNRLFFFPTIKQKHPACPRIQNSGGKKNALFFCENRGETPSRAAGYASARASLTKKKRREVQGGWRTRHSDVQTLISIILTWMGG